MRSRAAQRGGSRLGFMLLVATGSTACGSQPPEAAATALAASSAAAGSGATPGRGPAGSATSTATGTSGRGAPAASMSSGAGMGGRTASDSNGSADHVGGVGSGGAAGGGSEEMITATVGTGEFSDPALGPAPSDSAKVGGTPFVLVKNWDFGTNGTIRNADDLVAEFVFHDSFNTIANWTHYGAVMVAPTEATAIAASNLGLPNNRQPVEDPARPNREYTADTLKAHVLPLSASQTSASVSAHNAGSGSFTAKWKLPKGGSLLRRDLLWETRIRFPTPGKAYRLSLWAAGSKWNGGAQMDVLESFGSPNTYPPANSFRVGPVGGSATVNYSSWPSALDSVGVTADKRDLTQWHIFSWFYAKDDTYKVYFDGKQVQSGNIHWTYGGGLGGEAIDLQFLFDFGWGWVASGSEKQIPGLNAELPASAFPITYEVDYSRVYLR
jgi:hypothetical protein